VTLETDAAGQIVTAIDWKKTSVAGTMLADPGVYCRRSNEMPRDAERLWRTSVRLTDLEAVFRSLKGALGLRPIFDSQEERSDGHRFLSVLAYSIAQAVRRRLKAEGIHLSWTTRRDILSVQLRVTARFTQQDGRTRHVRKSTQPEPDLARIYEALALDHWPGGTRKRVA